MVKPAMASFGQPRSLVPGQPADDGDEPGKPPRGRLPTRYRMAVATNWPPRLTRAFVRPGSRPRCRSQRSPGCWACWAPPSRNLQLLHLLTGTSSAPTATAYRGVCDAKGDPEFGQGTAGAAPQGEPRPCRNLGAVPGSATVVHRPNLGRYEILYGDQVVGFYRV